MMVIAVIIISKSWGLLLKLWWWTIFWNMVEKNWFLSAVLLTGISVFEWDVKELTNCFLDQLVQTQCPCQRFCFCLWHFYGEKVWSKFGHAASSPTCRGRWGSRQVLYPLDHSLWRSKCYEQSMVSESPTVIITIMKQTNYLIPNTPNLSYSYSLTYIFFWWKTKK